MTDSAIEEIQKGLTRYIEKVGAIVVEQATVTAVNANNYTADVLTIRNVKKSECRLRAIINGSQSVEVLPVIGTKVLLLKIDEDDYYVLASDLISSYKVKVGSSQFEITQAGISFNNGTQGGILKAPQLLTELAKLQVQVEAIMAMLVSVAAVAPLTPMEQALVLAAGSLQGLPKALFMPTLINTNVTH